MERNLGHLYECELSLLLLSTICKWYIKLTLKGYPRNNIQVPTLNLYGQTVYQVESVKENER